MRTAEEYVHLAEAELDHQGHGGDGDRQVARAAVYAALAGIAQSHHTAAPVTIRDPFAGTHQCANHTPTQHRDGKAPWCNTCGKTASGVPHQDLPGIGARPEENRP